MARNPNTINLTTPVGRIVQGDVDELRDKDAQGKPYVIKTGPNTGQPTKKLFFAVAIPKNGSTHWAQTEWGGKIWQVGHIGQPTAGQNRNFAWKIVDGDSIEYNQAVPPKRWCDYEGYPGHWVMKFSGSFLPRLYSLLSGGAPQEIVQRPSGIECGYFVEVNLDCAPNGDAGKPGVYLNATMVCLRAYGQKIVSGPDVAQAGFGGAALPAGATMTPPAGFNPAQPPAAPAGGGAVPVPGAPSAPIPGTPAPPATAGYSTLPPAPNPAFLGAQQYPAPPVPGAAPPVPGVVPPPMPATAAASPPPPIQPTAKMQQSGNMDINSWLASGWTVDTLRAGGYIV